MRVVSVVSFHVAMSMAESVFVRFCLAVCACMCACPHTPHSVLISHEH